MMFAVHIIIFIALDQASESDRMDRTKYLKSHALTMGV